MDKKDLEELKSIYVFIEKIIEKYESTEKKIEFVAENNDEESSEWFYICLKWFSFIVAAAFIIFVFLELRLSFSKESISTRFFNTFGLKLREYKSKFCKRKDDDDEGSRGV